MYSAHVPQCVLHLRQGIKTFSTLHQPLNPAQQNNSHLLNFHGAFFGHPFCSFSCLFWGNKSSNSIFFLPLSCHAIQCVVLIMHVGLICECMMSDCTESTQWVPAAAERKGQVLVCVRKCNNLHSFIYPFVRWTSINDEAITQTLKRGTRCCFPSQLCVCL